MRTETAADQHLHKSFPCSVTYWWVSVLLVDAREQVGQLRGSSQTGGKGSVRSKSIADKGLGGIA